MNRVRLWSLGAGVVLLMTAPLRADAAMVDLINTEGKTVGTAKITDTPNGLLIELNAESISPGAHGFHIHTVGKCDPPDFKSAGGHFNPTSEKHGILNKDGKHAGDLPNVWVEKDGMLRVDVFSTEVSLVEAKTAVLDEDGGALVMHEKADDYTSDPAGNAGARIVCGVIKK